MSRTRRTPEALREAATGRFWAKVDKRGPDECWEWTGYRWTQDYGVLVFCGRRQGAHRYSFEIHHGPIPEGICVCHACDNPPCVNPAHLFLGTIADNNADMVRKGRHKPPKVPIGEAVKSAKLDAGRVREIRGLAAAGVSKSEIARRFQVSRRTIQFVISRRSWAHVSDEERVTSVSIGRAA